MPVRNAYQYYVNMANEEKREKAPTASQSTQQQQQQDSSKTHASGMCNGLTPVNTPAQ